MATEYSIGLASGYTEDATHRSHRWYIHSRINRMGGTAAAAASSIGLIGGLAAADILFLHENAFELILI